MRRKFATISEISKASANFNKIRSLGGKQYSIRNGVKDSFLLGSMESNNFQFYNFLLLKYFTAYSCYDHKFLI